MPQLQKISSNFYPTATLSRTLNLYTIQEGSLFTIELNSSFKFQVIWRPTVSCSVSGIHLGPTARFLLLSDICESPSLTRRRVCDLLVQFAVTLESKALRTHDHILLSCLRLPSACRARSPVFISPSNMVAQIFPSGTVFPFRRLVRLARTTMEVF
jgi:hypothetical protein